MKSVNIKGKNYIMVNERLKHFRANYLGWCLTSEIVSLTEDSCVIKATIVDADGRVVATGFAQEDRTSSMINKTSFVENCETSGWGRALGNLGIGIDDTEHPNWFIAPASRNERQHRLRSLTTYYEEHIEDFRPPKSLDVLMEVFD